VNNKNNNFSIVGVYVHKNCKYTKILNSGYYALNDAYEDTYAESDKDKNNPIVKLDENKKILSPDFFGINISISAIVGENGSGKSSLLDMIYRIINNLASVCFITDDPNDNQLSFVDDIYATLYFSKNGELHTVGFQGDTVYFDDKKYTLFIDSDTDRMSIIDKIKKDFFYTVVLNYSFQSFISRDYWDEKSSDPRKYNKRLPCWIDNIFHKNDGYQTPIVLNPFRDNGHIDLNKEFNFTVDRLSSILIQEEYINSKVSNFDEKTYFLDGYELENIKYEFDENKILDTYPAIYKSSLQYDISEFNLSFYSDENKLYKCASFYKAFHNKDSVANIILQEYGYSISDLKREKFQCDGDRYKLMLAFMYLVRKTLKIVITYIHYKYTYFSQIKSAAHIDDYKTNERYKHLNTFYAKVANKGAIEALVKEILDDPSHVTFKIKRVKNFIDKIIMGLKINYEKITYHFFYQNFKLYDNLDEVIKNLAPSFFSPTIYLKK